MQRRIFANDGINNGLGTAHRIAGLRTVLFDTVETGFSGGRFIVRQMRLDRRQRSAEEVGAERARLDDRDAYAQWREFLCERFRETFNGELGGVVNSPAGKSDQTADRREIH